MSSAAAATADSPGLLDRVQNFVSDNRRAVLIGAAAAAVAVGGAAYYAASTSRRAPSVAGSEPDLEKADSKGKKKPKSKKRKPAKDNDGPILEERRPKVEEVADSDDTHVLTPEEIQLMSTEERAAMAAKLKTRGNTAYTSRKFEIAAELYTQAIAVSPKDEPVFYSNRAACYVSMSPPRHDLVIVDCDIALSLDKTYVKALNRRASAHEQLGHYAESLQDYTAVTIIDRFKSEVSAQAVERVLKKLAESLAADILRDREPRLPTHTFVSAYFAAFRPRALPELPESPTTGDNTLIMGMQALEAADYVHAFTLINEAIDQGISWDKGKAWALNLRGTFNFLVSKVDESKADLQESLSIDPTLTQTWVKIASVHMEQGNPPAAFEAFEEAITQDANDPDIYYHRGQVLFIMNDFETAAQNYIKSTELDDKFVFSHIQLAVAYYKSGNLAKAMATFRSTLREFPTRSEPHNYYGELLMDQGRFEEAVEKFDKAVELERANPRPNVLPMVNKGLALYQWKQDVADAERCCYEALQIDSECEAAVATLAQLSLQQGNVELAVQLFDRQAQLARSEPELVGALTYKHATGAQLQFAKDYPELAGGMGQLARSLV